MADYDHHQNPPPLPHANRVLHQPGGGQMSKSLSVEQKVASHRFHRDRVTTSPFLQSLLVVGSYRDRFSILFRLSCDYNTCHPQHEPLLHKSSRNVRHALPLNSWCTRSNQINQAAIKTLLLLLLFVVTGSYHPKGSSSL